MEHTFECNHCHLVLASQQALDDHYCDRMMRHDALQTVTGQSCKMLYQQWLQIQGRPYLGDFMFITSRHFMPMLKFADYVKRMKLPKPFNFMQWALKRNLPPMLWRSGKVYTDYMDYVDNHVSPFDHLADSVKWMDNFCQSRNVPISDFFQTILGYELVDAVQSRSVTVWAILFSRGFEEYLKSGNLTTEQRIIIEVNLNTDRVAKTLEDDPELIDAIKSTLEGVGLR